MSRTFVSRSLSALVALTALALPQSARAQVNIKLGTLAPSGSVWHNTLKEMGQKWTEATNGQVKLTIYPGGVLGNEGDMVRKMRISALQAASLTAVGLHDVTPEPQAIAAPLAISSYEELEYVMERIEPKLNEAIEKKGYVVLSWSEVGFVHFFSSKSFSSMEGAKEAKIFAWDGDPDAVTAWKAGGFKPVVLSSTDIMPSLQSGMIDTMATSPLYALSARSYTKAKNMLNLPWAMLVGATIVKKDAWEKVPADVRAKLIAIAKEYSKRISTDVRRMNDEAIKTMKAQGLQVIEPTDMPGWVAAAQRANEVVRGKVVPAPIFDEVIRLRDEHRALKKAGGKK